LMSVASALKATIVIESELGAEGGRELDALLQTTGISIEPVTTGAVGGSLNWPPFRPDTWHEQGGLGISPSTGLCRTSTVASR
jgi:hypothetical protein